MVKRGEEGVGVIAIAVALLALLFVGTAIFAGFTYKDRNKYRDKTDAIVEEAVAKGKLEQAAVDKAKFAEDSKKPYKVFTGPDAYGSISFQYPKTWSAFVDTTSSSEPINGYFYPDIVPGTQSHTAYALRVELVNQSYAQTLQQFNSRIKSGQVKAAGYIPPKMKNVTGAQTGVMLHGAIGQDITGQMLIIQVRDKTLELSAQSTAFLNDFNNLILPKLTYTP